MKKVLFVNGSYNEIPLIKAAHNLGYFVITSGNDVTGEGHKHGDQYIPCDYSDKEAILKIARDERVDAVCSCGNDFGAISAAYAAEKLGLKGHDTVEVCKCFHEKNEFKRLCKELSINTPQSRVYNNKEEAKAAVEHIKFPQIVKPSDLGGGKGMMVVYTKEETLVAIEKAYNISKNKIILIEDYVEGDQYGYSCFIKDGKVQFDYFSRDLSYLNPYMVWTAVAKYQDEDVEVRRKIKIDVEKIAAHTHMYDGMLTLQLMVKDNTPCYIESMRRCLGNMHYLCLSNDLGIDVFELFVANELGLDTQPYIEAIECQNKTSAFMGIYSNKNGIYDGYEINKEFKKNLFFYFDIEQKGHIINDYLYDKLANIYFSFNSREERDNFLQNLHKVYTIKTKE